MWLSVFFEEVVDTVCGVGKVIDVVVVWDEKVYFAEVLSFQGEKAVEGVVGELPAARVVGGTGLYGELPSFECLGDCGSFGFEGADVSRKDVRLWLTCVLCWCVCCL